jgi:DNA-directed RNA polymerase specialized sigma24 family protein
MPPLDSELGRWFAAYVHPHKPMLRAWLRSRFRTETDLNDVVQKSYPRLLRARERGEVASPRAFLLAIARSLTLLTEAIQSLPARCRQIFTLRKVYGLSQAEIATRLGVSENTISAQLTSRSPANLRPVRPLSAWWPPPP